MAKRHRQSTDTPPTILHTLLASDQALETDRAIRVLGVDLGTTNSTVAELMLRPDMQAPPAARCNEFQQPTPSRGDHFGVLVPSVVAARDGEAIVGMGAKDLRARMGDLGMEQHRDIFWECKNDIGVRRTYHKAPEGFRSATDISAHVLRFLVGQAEQNSDQAAEATVVTIPASFQAAQRTATAQAATLAAIEVTDGSLLDEPVAAFIAYLAKHGVDLLRRMTGTRRLAIFDFGGGTCDVAVFELQPPSPSMPIGAAPLAVSRYTRLGGGDIDRAIVELVLLPQLIEQNALSSHDLSYRDKSKHVFPAFLGVAEALKIGLCTEIERLRKFGRYDDRRPDLVQKNPGLYRCALPSGKELRLVGPTLSAIQFEDLLEPFLDPDLLYMRESDYRMTCSIFAPLTDALEHAGSLTREDIDYCLLVGGSSLVPQVQDALDGFFAPGKLLHFSDAEEAQTAVAVGAAWQALSLRLHGQSIFPTVAGHGVSIDTANGPMELIAKGVPVPHPRAPGDWAANNQLRVPADGPVALRLVLRNSGNRVVMSEVFQLPSDLRKGDPLYLQYRMDANQVLDLSLGLESDPETRFRKTVENPFTHVVNPSAKRDEILRLEESMRTGEIAPDKRWSTVRHIAELYADLGKRETAIDLLKALNLPKPRSGILNQMGILAGEMGDYESEEKYFREASRVGFRWNGPLFNLALSYRKRNEWTTAMSVLDEAIRVDEDGPRLVLKVLLAESLHWSTRDRCNLLEKARTTFGPLALLTKFELGWYRIGARLSEDCGKPWPSPPNAEPKSPELAEDSGHLPDRRDRR